MPFEMFRLDADGRVRPFRSVIRRRAVDRLITSEQSPAFAVDTNSLVVVGASPAFPDAAIVGMPLNEALVRLGMPPAADDDGEATPAGPARPMQRHDFELVGPAEAFGHTWMALAVVVIMLTLLTVMVYAGTEDSSGWMALAILVNGLLTAAVLASLGLVLRVTAATLRRTLER